MLLSPQEVMEIEIIFQTVAIKPKLVVRGETLSKKWSWAQKAKLLRAKC